MEKSLQNKTRQLSSQNHHFSILQWLIDTVVFGVILTACIVPTIWGISPILSLTGILGVCFWRIGNIIRDVRIIHEQIDDAATDDIVDTRRV